MHTHIGGIAIVDVILTLLGAWLIARSTGWNLGYTTLGLFILGIILHHVFCVQTTVSKLIQYISISYNSTVHTSPST